jgi:hypothetical protein
MDGTCTQVARKLEGNTGKISIIKIGENFQDISVCFSVFSQKLITFFFFWLHWGLTFARQELVTLEPLCQP